MDKEQPKKAERIELLDLTRGVALLGILLMNIRIFSEPYAAYFNPLAYGSYEGLNQLWWNLQYFVADQKFMAIFSMLFGASTALICDQLAAKQLNVSVIFGRRIVLLLLIGLIHAYLIWHGDILVTYALCSLLPFWFRHARWQVAVAVGLLLLILGSLNSWYSYDAISAYPAHIQQHLAQIYWSPSATDLAAEIAAFQGTWLEQFSYRAALAYHFQTDTFLAWGVWRVSGLMLIGLGLYRLGYLSGTFTLHRYQQFAAVFLVLGVALVTTGYNANVAGHWGFPASLLQNNLWNYWGSLFMALGYIALFALFQKRELQKRELQKKELQKKRYLHWLCVQCQGIGRTALSNYLLQSVICTALFYGLALFATLERALTSVVVIAVWIIQLVITHYWLKSHNMGPVESWWRKLTYGKQAREEKTA